MKWTPMTSMLCGLPDNSVNQHPAIQAVVIKKRPGNVMSGAFTPLKSRAQASGAETPPYRSGMNMDVEEEVSKAAARLLLLKVPRPSGGDSPCSTPPLARKPLAKFSAQFTPPLQHSNLDRAMNAARVLMTGSPVASGSGSGTDSPCLKRKGADPNPNPASAKAPTKRIRRNSSTSGASRRALKNGNENVAPGEAGKSDAAKFYIKGIQGQLEVCEKRTIKVGGAAQPYLLVRLRGQSNTLPNDATLSVTFPHKHPSASIDVHFARVRLKAGELKYDFLPKPTTLTASDATKGGPGGKVFEANLIASIFSKKCWQGMVVRGPRMFVAFIGDGSKKFHSVPMFVEISPTSNSPEYRDPVIEYPKEVIDLFFSTQTVGHVFGKHQAACRKGPSSASAPGGGAVGSARRGNKTSRR